MPKRRTTPKQKAASRRNGKQHKGTPRGKTITLFHRTSSKAAKSIVSQKSFTPDLLGRAHFSNRSAGDANGFGKAVVSVTVPLGHATRAKKYGFSFAKPTGEHFYTVPVKALQGKKIRRHI